jgi:predicted enzyme related to lactoylglutathione lyase
LNRALIVILISLGLVTSCATVDPNLPAMSRLPTGLHDSGRIVWRDLLTTTPDETRAFYSELFGWEFERPASNIGFGQPDTYMLIRHKGRVIGGMFDATTLQREVNVSQWVTMMSVADIDAAVARMTEHGGEVLTPPTDVGERGWLALVTGPDGALLGLVQTRDGDPPEVEPRLNEWLWDELWTDDVNGATNTLESVAGLAVETRTVNDAGVTYRVLESGGHPRAGLMQMPFDGERPVWVNYIRVEDPAAITSRVSALGGRIIVDVQARPVGGRAAMIAGPSGAGVALQTWPMD